MWLALMPAANMAKAESLPPRRNRGHALSPTVAPRGEVGWLWERKGKADEHMHKIFFGHLIWHFSL